MNTSSQPAAGIIPSIFVSHSHLDNAFCRPFVAHLRAALGLRDPTQIFYDESALHLGDDWLHIIQQEVMRRPIFIVVLTPHSVQADYVKVETTLALRASIGHPERRVFSVLAEPCDPNQLAPLLLNYQMADIVKRGYDAAVEELVETIRAFARGEPIPPDHGEAFAPPPPTPPAPDPRLARARELAVEAREALAQNLLADAIAKADAALERFAILGTQVSAADRADVLVTLADACSRSNLWPRALDAATGGRKEDPDRLECYLLQAAAEGELNRPDDAQKTLDAARVVVPLNNPALRLKLLAAQRAFYTRQRRWDEALAVLDDEQRLAPHDPTLAQARQALLTPPIDPTHTTPRLADLAFAASVVRREGTSVEVIVPPVCDIPAGPFLMGSDPKLDSGAYDTEKPQHQVTLAAFQIARYPVTVAEYACYQRTLGKSVATDELDHPVVNVSWHNAMAYAAWLAKTTGQPWRLPTEAEWEKAARWDAANRHSRIYPWGDAFDKVRCNTSESGKGGTTPVGSYPSGASPCGAQEMAGNVWEWTSSAFKSYPYDASDGRERADSTDNRVLRGGSWGSVVGLPARPAAAATFPITRGGIIGFRVARSLAPS